METVVDVLTTEHRTAMTKFLTQISGPARLALLDAGTGTSSSAHNACLVSALTAENVSLVQTQREEEEFLQAYYSHRQLSSLADVLSEFAQPNLESLLNMLQPEFGHSTDCSKAFDAALVIVTLSTLMLTKPVKKGDERFLVSLLSTPKEDGDVLRSADRVITDNGKSTIIQALFDIYLTTIIENPVLGQLSVSLTYKDSSGQPAVFEANVVDLLNADKMIHAPIDLRKVYKFGPNDPVSVLFDPTGEGKTTLYGQLWRYFTEFFLLKLPAQASTSRTTSNGRPSCVPALRQFAGTNNKTSRVSYKEDNDGDDPKDDTRWGSGRGKRHKTTHGGGSSAGPKSKPRGGLSASPIGRPRSTVDNAIPNPPRVVAPTAPFTIASWFPSPATAQSGLVNAEQSLVAAGIAKYMRVTIKPVSHEGNSHLIVVPVITSHFRELLRTACGTRARFPSSDLVAETAKQPLLRYGVHVHNASGNPSACVSIYRSHKFITFSSDGLYGSDKLGPSSGVDWTKTSDPLTFQVMKVDSQLSSNTLHVDSAGLAVILPTVFSGADVFYPYLSSCLTSPRVVSHSMKDTVDAHFSLEKSPL